MQPTVTKISSSIANITTNSTQTVDANEIYTFRQQYVQKIADIDSQLSTLATAGVYPDATNPSKS